MINQVLMPKLEQTQDEGIVAKWHKEEGDPVAKGEVLLEVETDKAVVEVEADQEGVLRKVVVPEGTKVPVLSLIAWIGDPEDEIPEQDAAPSATPEPAPASHPEALEPTPAAPPAPVSSEPAVPQIKISPRARTLAHELGVDLTALKGSGPGGRIEARDVEAVVKAAAAAPPAEVRPARRFSSPRARMRAHELSVDLSGVQGTGPRGRVVERDVLAYAETIKAAPAMPEIAPAPPAVAPAVPPPTLAPAPPALEAKRVPYSAFRQAMVRQLVGAKQAAPHFYVTMDIDMTWAVTMRGSLLDEYERMHAVRPTLNDVILKASALALERSPQVNATTDGEAVDYHDRVNIALAVALDDGVMMPVVHDANRKSLVELARTSRDLAARARERKLSGEEMGGGTFAITNLGAYGVSEFTGVIYTPQVAILAVGAVEERPVVLRGGIHVRQMLSATLSCDHRVVDGVTGARFLQQLKAILESPGVLFDTGG